MGLGRQRARRSGGTRDGGIMKAAPASIPQFHLVSGAATHVGCVRKLNEDSYLDRADLGLWAVADGMGGHDAGDHASQHTIAALDQIAQPTSAPAFLSAVKSALESANADLRQEAAGHGPGRIIASTVVTLLAYGQHYACVWAGDSRLYRLRDETLQQVSRDHSHVQEMIDTRLLSPEEARNHPYSNVVTRAIGAADLLELETCHDRLRSGDLFLLCSDGLTKEVEDDEVRAILMRESLFDAPYALIESAIARGARDNVTVVAVQCRVADG
jgi:serine/threonine protein phosphatase PrpC